MKKITYFLLFAFSLQSCFNDLGNYDYNPIADITIDEVPESLGDLILFEDTIRISPIVGPQTDVDAGNLNYHWSIKTGSGSAAKMVRFSDEKNLVLPVTQSGDIFLRFEVENKETGIVSFVTTKAIGTSKMSNGIYLLKETADGNTDVDMIGFDSQTGEATTYPDLATVLLGDHLEGGPVTIDYWGYRIEDYENAQLVAVPAIRFASQKDLVVVNTDKFEVLGRFDDMFLGDAPQVRNIQALKSISRNTMLINDGKVYCFTNYYIAMVNSVSKEYGGNRFFPAMVGDYYMDSHISWGVKDAAANFLTYDQKSGLFRNILNSSSVPKAVKEYPNQTAFASDLKSNLLFLESTASGAYAYNQYALMQKKSYPDSLMLIDMNAQNLENSYLIQNKRDVLMASDYQIDNASLWCVHQHRKLIFFAVGNKLYKYDTTAKTEVLVMTLPSEITFIDCVNEWYTVGDGVINKLEYTKFVLATASGSNYQLYKFNMNGDVPEQEPYFTTTGSGRIKDYVYIKPTATPIWMRTIN
ncbi:MAG: PKD-like family lipoprotein [Mangrovibacterium sp.]